MASFVDSHAHLASQEFEADVDAVVERARLSGARAVVCIGESLRSAEGAAALAARYPGFLSYTAGVHPHDAADFDAERDIPLLRRHALGGAVAIGECGLDYHYDHSPRDMQRAALDSQIALAAEVGLPVVIHTREAEPDTVAAINDARELGVLGVLHCFTGTESLARHALDAGWYVSFSGIVTFRKWTDTALLRLVPDDRLLVESDSPYLAPVPHRGKRNEPAWVSLTLARLAEVRGTTAAELGERTVANAFTFFGLATSGTP